jgi:hypothetical protein
MRIVITAVATKSQIAKLTEPLDATILHLLAQPVVSAIYLLVEYSHAAMFKCILEIHDPRFEILPVIVGSGIWSCYLWHYQDLPEIAARLRADVVHFAYPVPVKRGAYFPPTAFSLEDRNTADPFANSSVVDSLVTLWVRRNYFGMMDETARLSEPLCLQLGLGRAHHSRASSQKGLTVGQPGSPAVITGLPASPLR